MNNLSIKTVGAVLILFFSSLQIVSSQTFEEFPASFNPVLKGKGQNEQQIELRSSSIADTISIGINGLFEDFSYLNAYPDTSIWLDSTVFINRGYGWAPPTIGVATFDGLAANGFPYNFYAGTVVSNPADTLTSKPIDLTPNYSIDPAFDSIYLSFYYQAQGIGNDPQTDDSLVLEFKGPDNSTWNHAWSRAGYALPTNDSSWHLVMIPIIKLDYIKKGFQFRFRNYASTNANADQWNIDNIYLNRTRAFDDTVQIDVSWVYDGQSLLTKYRAMPWKHYSSSELRSSINVLIRNNDDLFHNIGYQYTIDNLTSVSNIATYAGNSNIYPFAQNNIYTDCDLSLGCISTAGITTSSFPSSLSAPTQLSITHYFNALPGDVSSRNDTLSVINNFSNYFAYDDGGAESEVGLVNALDGKLALKFTLNTTDTLSCVDIYFNPFMTNAELYAFYLTVWSDNGGTPGLVVYVNSVSSSPEYQKTGHNAFTRYYFEIPQLLPAGTYYVGFSQKTTESLNVGLDKNNLAPNSLFYNVGSGWASSPYSGALMMRPIMGFVPYVGIDNHLSQESNTFTVYPNPTRDELNVKIHSQNELETFQYQICDMLGKLVDEGTLDTSAGINVSDISSGVYIIKIFNTTFVASQKFVKVN